MKVGFQIERRKSKEEKRKAKAAAIEVAVGMKSQYSRDTSNSRKDSFCP